MTHADILSRLEQIEHDIADRQLAGEGSAERFYRAKKEYERAWAEAYIATEGTVEERRQRTILKTYQSDAYKELVRAEGEYEGWRAVMRALETRASIGQSLLRASTREAPQMGQQPEWTSAHAQGISGRQPRVAA